MLIYFQSLRRGTKFSTRKKKKTVKERKKTPKAPHPTAPQFISCFPSNESLGIV